MKSNGDLKLPVLFGGISFSSRTENKENMVSIIGDCFLEVTAPILDFMDMRVIFECMKDFQEKSNNGWAISNDASLLRDSANEYLLENKNKFVGLYKTIVDKKKGLSDGEWTAEMNNAAYEEARKAVLAPFFYFGESLNEAYIKEFNVMDI